MKDWGFRMEKVLMIVFLLFAQSLYANQALNELNLITKEKSAIQNAKFTHSKELDDLQKNYELIFIHRSNCPHCHQFAPVLDDFSRTFSINVKAYSVDGGQLAPFESEKLSSEHFRTFFLSSGFKPIVPALFLLNKETFTAYPVLFGEAEPYQLASRISELMEHIKEQFNDEI